MRERERKGCWEMESIKRRDSWVVLAPTSIRKNRYKYIYMQGKWSMFVTHVKVPKRKQFHYNSNT